MVQVRPGLGPELAQCAERFDLLGVAGFYRDVLRTNSPASYDDVLALLPILQQNDEVVEGGAGRMSFATLAKDGAAKRFLVLAALFNCRAPGHLHVQGERTVNLFGNLLEHSWAHGHFSTELVLDGVAKLDWSEAALSFHEPFTEQDAMSVVLYEQPRGLKLFEKMLKPDLETVLSITRGVTTRYFGEQWDSWDDETARAKVAKDLGLAYSA